VEALARADDRRRSLRDSIAAALGDSSLVLAYWIPDQQIYVASRLGRMRVAPHVYNDEGDIDRFVAALKSALP